MLSDTINFFKNVHFLSATASEGVWQLNICLHPSTTSWERVEKIFLKVQLMAKSTTRLCYDDHRSANFVTHCLVNSGKSYNFLYYYKLASIRNYELASKPSQFGAAIEWLLRIKSVILLLFVSCLWFAKISSRITFYNYRYFVRSVINRLI